ncbi:MAG: acyl-[acyl-carrier-protein] thioesterase [Anaerolineales bacterium]|nr:acyl-[acyl-carrier-protein] thioesterase [Anaerolineales bacterium]
MDLSSHTARYTIRHGECDPLQHVYTGSYFRLMQEASVETLLASGKDLQEDNKVWIPALAYLDMNIPLHRGEEIEIRVTPISHGKTGMAFDYTFRRVDGTVTTTASIDWRLQPADSSSQDRDDPAPQAESHVPEPPSLTTPPKGLIQHQVPVGWCDISQEQVIYNARYMDTMVNAAMQAGNTYGWTWERLHREDFVFVAKKQWLAYHASAHLNDQIEVTTWLAQVRRSTALRQYRIHRISDGMLLAEGNTLFVTIDMHSGRPVRIPERFKQDLAAHISPDG